jgi:hypothetical protein
LRNPTHTAGTLTQNKEGKACAKFAGTGAATAAMTISCVLNAAGLFAETSSPSRIFAATDDQRRSAQLNFALDVLQQSDATLSSLQAQLSSERDRCDRCGGDV